MAQSFAPWIDGSTALDLSQLPSAKSLPHLRVVPSAPEYDDDDYESKEKEVLKQDDYEGILVFAIKVLSVVLLFCCVALIGLGIGFALRGNTDNAIIVQSGDSLYSIGASLPGAPSPSRAVEDIRSLNALGSDTLYAGQKLILPEY